MASGQSTFSLSADIPVIISRVRRLSNRSRVSLTPGKPSICLDASRLTRFVESLLGHFLPLRKHRRPGAIGKIAQPSIFGRQLYELIGRSS
jgi:hypothetical protein